MHYSEQRHHAAVERREAIVRYLAGNPGADTHTIAAEFAQTYATIYAALRHLADEERVDARRVLVPALTPMCRARTIVHYFVKTTRQPVTLPFRIPARDELVAALFGPAGIAAA